MMKSKQRTSVGINGFGRFGMHLLRYWIQNYDEALFDVEYINDEMLTVKDIETVLRNDPYINLGDGTRIESDNLSIKLNNEIKSVHISHTPLREVSWIGQTELLLECSGKYTENGPWQNILVGRTKQIVISATSMGADGILVYGHNHKDYDPNTYEVISYGSCTVNAYIPLAKWVHENWGIIDSDVSVIHNIPVHRSGSFNTLEKRKCTLETVAPKLLDFTTPQNFDVNYTLVPYTGPSMIDFRFRLETSQTSVDEIRHKLTMGTTDGILKDLYTIIEHDTGPETHKFSTYSAILVADTIRLRGNNLYLNAYFDNENSVNRYFDLVNYMLSRNGSVK